MSGTTTKRHTLQLALGPMHCDLTESPAGVRVEITGCVPLGFERRKVRRFLEPLVMQYDTDPRTLSVGGRGADSVGHFATVQGLGVVYWATPAGSKA